MKIFSNTKKSLWLALGYSVFILGFLYFAPFVAQFLKERLLLKNFVDGVYISIAIGIPTLFFGKYHIRSSKAYLSFFLLMILFLFEFFNTPILVERFHYLEYALFYAVWFRVFRHPFGKILCYGATFLWGALFGLVDEGIQKLLPNRYFDWQDVLINITGALFGMAMVAILMRYRRDRKKVPGTFLQNDERMRGVSKT